MDDQQNLADERCLADTSVREEESAEIWATLDRRTLLASFLAFDDGPTVVLFVQYGDLLVSLPMLANGRSSCCLRSRLDAA